MYRTALLAIALIAVMCLTLTACSQNQNQDQSQSQDTAADEGSTETEAMTECLFAGTGATFPADDKRVSFTCYTTEDGEEVVLAGETEVGEEGWLIDQATVVSTDDGFETLAAAMVPVLGINLEDGTECLFAGTGATFGVEGQRVNYTCGTNETGEDVVLAGDIQVDDEGWLILKGTVVSTDDGWETQSSEIAVISGLEVPATE